MATKSMGGPLIVTTEIETRKMKLPALQRAIGDVSMEMGEEDRTLEFPFSSELAVERWFGDEVLSHRDGAADLTRLNDSAPLLWNHDPDQMIGVVEGARIGTDKRGYAKVRFGTSAKAEEILSDVRAGIIRNVSFGYRINEMTEEKRDGSTVYTATRWTPLEVSLVSIPADQTVGLGRSEAEEARELDVVVRGEPVTAKEIVMEATAPAQPVDTSAVRAEAVTAERERISAIRALGEKYSKSDLSDSLINSGRSIDEARAAFLDALEVRAAPVAESGTVDLSEKEQRDYSLVRAINAAITGDWSKAGLEREASMELGRQSGRETTGFFMPTNLSMRAAYNVGTAAQGGDLVATNLLASSFIDVLRNNALVMNLGPTVLTGLTGNVAIPRQTSQTATYWVAEAEDITEAEATFDQVTLTPKQIGARSQYSRLALQQTTPDIEAVVRNDLARVMALGIDLAAIAGTGSSGQPTGILNTSGIGSVAMGTNGAALSSLDPLVNLEKLVDVANALNGSLNYVTNAKVVAALKLLKDSSGRPLWSSNDHDTTLGTAGRANGYPVARSNQVPSNLSKGTGSNLSALIFGNFNDLIIGMWGGLEILPNPYGAGYNKGSVDIRAMQTCDVAVRHAASFAAIKDIVAA